MRILVVEDDSLLAEGLVNVLSRSGHAVDYAATGSAADLALKSTEFDLIVLDVGLPDIDGFELLHRLRERRSSAAVLVLTARDAVEERVHGLDIGANDYMTKPFSVAEFEARVRALLRRSAVPEAQLSAGTLSMDLSAKRARVGGRPIELTLREWSLLELFLTRPRRVLSKDQILEHLLTYDEHLSANSIEVYISRLRAKIEPEGARLRTIRGFGYLWDAASE
jgi:two-component system OmpR family response regulator/two-component system response regulator TctD